MRLAQDIFPYGLILVCLVFRSCGGGALVRFTIHHGKWDEYSVPLADQVFPFGPWRMPWSKVR